MTFLASENFQLLNKKYTLNKQEKTNSEFK